MVKNPDQGGLRQKMQYSEDKESEGQITPQKFTLEKDED